MLPLRVRVRVRVKEILTVMSPTLRLQSVFPQIVISCLISGEQYSNHHHHHQQQQHQCGCEQIAGPVYGEHGPLTT